MNFKRNPSRVFYASDSYRENSSPASQEDSGFSDSETSPKRLANNLEETPKKQQLPSDIFKESSNERNNLNENYKEKCTPNKEKILGAKSDTKIVVPCNTERGCYTEPIKKQRFNKNSPKVSRNLFKNQICASPTNQNSTHTQGDTVDCNDIETKHASASSSPCHDFSLEKTSENSRQVLEEDEATTSFNSLSSDCESELECLFEKGLESPGHTSTPTGETNKMRHAKPRREMVLRKRITIENPAVQKWLAESRLLYDPECMTTLQCKSIAADVHQMVAHLAATTTNNIRNILHHSKCIETDYRHLNSEKKHVGALLQSLAGNILDFLKTFTTEITSKTLKLYDEIRTSPTEDSLKLLSNLFVIWENSKQNLLTKEVKTLVEKLESPLSEIALKATVTGITSICLRNEELVEIFVRNETIPILLIFCEKCEGSSCRTLLLRALSTMCCNAEAVRQLEKYSGVQLISDVLKDHSRPEPERTEAVALLAQSTAPWIEGGGRIRGLRESSSTLVSSLTKFLTTATCSQTLLLSTAALANLASTDTSSINHMIEEDTATILLSSISSRRHITSIHLLEQAAGLLAGLAGASSARKKLGEAGAVAALLFFVGVAKRSNIDEDGERRLLQKSVVALSRLCGEREACKKVVELGGMEELVKLCREKELRRDSDAVLVAALATLRKVVDVCGTDMLNSQDIQELIQPKLLDSFLAYSTQNESYV